MIMLFAYITLKLNILIFVWHVYFIWDDYHYMLPYKKKPSFDNFEKMDFV